MNIVKDIKSIFSTNLEFYLKKTLDLCQAVSRNCTLIVIYVMPMGEASVDFHA